MTRKKQGDRDFVLICLAVPLILAIVLIADSYRKAVFNDSVRTRMDVLEFRLAHPRPEK
jgi:hypothetical protein